MKEETAKIIIAMKPLMDALKSIRTRVPKKYYMQMQQRLVELLYILFKDLDLSDETEMNETVEKLHKYYDDSKATK